MSISNSTAFKIPDPKELILNDKFATKIKDYQKEGQINVWRTFLYAAALRNKYMNKDNSSGRETWDPEFKDWYKKNKMETKLGSMSQLSKCAAAGDVICKFAEMFSDNEEWIHCLPTSMNALYEVSKLIKGMTPKQINKLIYVGGGTFSEDDDEPVGIINPVATAESIRTYRQLLEDKGNPKENKKTMSARKREFTVPVATIFVSKSFFKFDNKGEHLGNVSIESIRDRVDELKQLISEQFDVRDRFPEIKKRYDTTKKKKNPVTKVYGSKKSATLTLKKVKS
jgi:hypothetical protein